MAKEKSEQVTEKKEEAKQDTENKKSEGAEK